MRSRREGKKESKLKENRGDERDWISIEWQAVLNSYLWRDAFNA